MVRIKHWALFALLVGPALAASFFSEPGQISSLEISANIIASIVYFSWIWAINRYTSTDNMVRRETLFKICFVFVFTYFLGYNSYLLLVGAPQAFLPSYWIDGLILTSMVYCLARTSKGLKSFELNRPASPNEYFWYLLLLFVFPIGVWVLQPKINKLEVQQPE